MKLLVISTAPFIKKNDGIYAYSPYVKELEIWQKNADEILFCCPFWKTEGDLLISKIPFPIVTIFQLKEFNFTSFYNAIKSVPTIISNCIVLYKSIQKADAIHLRCPGNIGLLASFVQILFPSKRKSAKYAGNWDSKAKQPISYTIQKSILSSTFLTKNMKVLVYGEWKNQSKNIIPFFTATYSEAEIVPIQTKSLKGKIKFIFVGMLSKGKQPLYAIKMVEELKKLNFDVQLDLYGDGNQRTSLEEYCKANALNSFISLKGNRNRDEIKKIYQESHFIILPSKSEGWPKVIAEAMFWGCLPIATNVSCVANMLHINERGILLTEHLSEDVKQIQECINNENDYQQKIIKAANWSREFTIDKFELEIQKIIKS